MVGIIFVVFGAIGCYVMGAFLDRTKKFLLAVRLVNITLFSTFALSLLILPIGKLWITSTFALFGGLFNVPFLPASFHYAGSLANKFPPTLINGFMMATAQTWAVASTLITTYLLQFGQNYGLAYMAITILVAQTCTSFLRAEDDSNRCTDLKHAVMADDSDDDEDSRVAFTSEDLEGSYSLFHA